MRALSAAMKKSVLPPAINRVLCSGYESVVLYFDRRIEETNAALAHKAALAQESAERERRHLQDREESRLAEASRRKTARVNLIEGIDWDSLITTEEAANAVK